MAFKGLKMPDNPTLLRAVAAQCGIKQSDLAKITGMSDTMINICIMKGVLPSVKISAAEFCGLIEQHVAGDACAREWLRKMGAKIGDIWRPASEFGITVAKQQMPVDLGARARAGRVRSRDALVLADPMETKTQEVEMLTIDAAKHFKIFVNPFLREIESPEDAYMSDEHRYIESAMVDAARHQGFIAVVGEVGSGKSAMKKKVLMGLKRDDKVRIIYPRIMENVRVTASTLCDAIITDLNPEAKRPVSPEMKARLVEKLLTAHASTGGIACLIIEEAHDLPIPALKRLKRFWEIEDGYRKALGIILIGQTELGDRLDERIHPEMREVIQRCQVARIRGLNGNIRDYLLHKCARVKADLSRIITDDGIKALSERLTVKDGRKAYSRAYPLKVGNEITLAMNLAAEMGEPVVTAEVINQL